MALNQTYQNTLPYFVILKGLKNAPKIFTANLFFILIFTILRTRLCCTRKKRSDEWRWLLTHFWKADYDVVGVGVAVPHLLWINSRSGIFLTAQTGGTGKLFTGPETLVWPQTLGYCDLITKLGIKMNARLGIREFILLFPHFREVGTMGPTAGWERSPSWPVFPGLRHWQHCSVLCWACSTPQLSLLQTGMV